MKEIDLLKEFANKALVKFLSKQHAEDVSFHNKSIRLKFLGQKLSYRVVKKRVGVIGNSIGGVGSVAGSSLFG